MEISIEDKVKKMAAEKFVIDEKTISLESNFRDLNADSLDSVEFMMELEKEFSISIPDSDFESLTNVGNIISYIEGKKK